MTLVGVLVHDRPDLLRRCLDSLPPHGTCAFYCDGATLECADLVRDRDGIFLQNHERKGAWYGLNQLLTLRAPGEAFLRVDSDTEFLDDWKPLLDSPFDIAAPWMKGKPTGAVGATASGAVLFKGHVVDRLGGFRGYGKYGGEDLDYFLRARGAGFSIGYDDSVKCRTEPENNTRGERRESLERALKALRAREPGYLKGEDVYEAVA
jgi:hypothetical protein